MNKAKALVGAYGYPEGVTITEAGPCAHNPDLTLFMWPGNVGGLWLEKHEYSYL